MPRPSTRCSLLFAAALVLCVVAGAEAAAAKKYRPVVLLHGLFSTAEGMSHFEGWLKQDYPGIYIHNAEIGNGKEDSLLWDMNKQAEAFAQQLAADGNLTDGIDIIAHSQGGLTSRAFIQRFNKPKVHNFISLAGPQAGVYGMPDVNDWCPDNKCPWIVKLMDKISMEGKYAPYMQKYVTFAQYWKDPVNYNLYLNASSYLPDINNERPVKNQTYKANLESLDNLVLVRAEEDHIVVPKVSPWFSFYERGQDKIIRNMTESQSYKENWIGLRTLNEKGKIAFEKVQCTHQNLCRLACKDVVYPIIQKFVGTQL